MHRTIKGDLKWAFFYVVAISSVIFYSWRKVLLCNIKAPLVNHNLPALLIIDPNKMTGLVYTYSMWSLEYIVSSHIRTRVCTSFWFGILFECIVQALTLTPSPHCIRLSGRFTPKLFIEVRGKVCETTSYVDFFIWYGTRQISWRGPFSERGSYGCRLDRRDHDKIDVFPNVGYLQ